MKNLIKLLLVANIFDPQTLKWTEGAKPPIEIHHFQAVVYNEIIYVIGAMTGRYPNEKPLSNIMFCNPVTDEWTLEYKYNPLCLPAERQAKCIAFKNTKHVNV